MTKFFTSILFIYLITLGKLYAQGPVVTSFNPSIGPIGTLITITGTNLNNATTINIGGIPAIIVSNSSTQISGMIMPGTLTGPVSITTSNGNTVSSGSFNVINTPYPTLQQGVKLVGVGTVISSTQGSSIAVSTDGNTTVVGDQQDNNGLGAAWIYVRTGNMWTQQGPKLVGTGAIYSALQGSSVAVSADGNTVAIGGMMDNNGLGSIWIFTRTNGVWTQQGNKLVGNGITGNTALFGCSVSMSADG